VELDRLKKNLTSCLDVEVKKRLVVPDARLSLSRQCELLGISRTAYYYRPTGISGDDVAMTRILDEVFTERP
jgi:putative transposase